ncbi:hypothetical protein, partial [Klebsiella pneumoniae]|uniref:hypothetical protein n=1 Tax=Klebsiella pneumoniae TaxID=573 RepID=UPI0015F2E6EB
MTINTFQEWITAHVNQSGNIQKLVGFKKHCLTFLVSVVDFSATANKIPYNIHVGIDENSRFTITVLVVNI